MVVVRFDERRFEVFVVVDFGLWVLGGRVDVCCVDVEEKEIDLGASFIGQFPALS